MKEKMLPCPFCGSEAVCFLPEDRCVACVACDARGSNTEAKGAETEDNAISLWNRCAPRRTSEYEVKS